MKKFVIAALALVMITAMLTGCGCTNSAAPSDPTVMPTILPSTQATRPSESASTETPTATASQPGSDSDAAGSSGSSAGDSGTAGGSGGMGSSGNGMDSDATETTEPLTSESGRVKSHINGNF